MDFLDRLRMLSRSKGLENNMQLSKASGVPYTTLDNFYRNGYENVKLSTLKKLAVCLGCTIEYLVNGSPDSNELSPEALEFARRFDKLDAHGKRVVSAVLDIESEERVTVRLPIVGTAVMDGSVETRHAARKEKLEMSDAAKAALTTQPT